MADNIITKDGHIKFSIPKVDTNFNKNNDYSFNNGSTR